MGDISEFSLSVQLFLKAYPWRRIEPVPWAPLAKPLSAARLALVSMAGLVPRDQEPFDETARGGDVGFREVPGDVDPSTFLDFHRSDTFDHGGIRQDPNLAFPVTRVRELAARGRIGSVAPRHLSFMGSITAPGRLVKHEAPRAAEVLVEDEVDVALLVPV